MKAKYIESIHGNTFHCQNSSIECTQILVPNKPICKVYYDCPTWPCYLTPDCSEDTELDTDCIEWSCKDTKEENGSLSYTLIGSVSVGLIFILLATLAIINYKRKYATPTNTEPRARGIVEEKRNWCRTFGCQFRSFVNFICCSCFICDGEIPEARIEDTDADIESAGLANDAVLDADNIDNDASENPDGSERELFNINF